MVENNDLFWGYITVYLFLSSVAIMAMDWVVTGHMIFSASSAEM